MLAAQHHNNTRILKETQEELQIIRTLIIEKGHVIESVRTELSESKTATAKELALRVQAERATASESALRLGAEKKLQAYQEETEGKLGLAAKLFANHEEVLQHYCKNEPSTVKEAVMKSLRDDFGQLKGRD